MELKWQVNIYHFNVFSFCFRLIRSNRCSQRHDTPRVWILARVCQRI